MKKLYLILLCSFCFLYKSFTQTVVYPIPGGGFDLGTTFPVNGWTVVNSSANKWVVGPHTFNSPPYSAYISSDGDTAHYSYDNTTAHISHFYMQVTLPANAFNITFSFQLKGNIQSGADLQDGLLVYTDESLTPPLADALPGGSANQAYFQFDQNITYTKQTVTLDGLALAGKTFLLIFTWVNNGDGIGDGPPASVDDAAVTYCLKSSDFTVTGGGAFCTGSPGVAVGLDGSTLGINYQLYHNGNPVGVPIAGTGSPLDFGPQNAPGNYTIAGSTSCNAGNFTFPMTGNVAVSENPLPVATAGSNAPICIGATLNLNSGGGISYNWTGPDGFTSTDQNPSVPDFTPGAAGIYTVTVTANGCSKSATTNVTVTAGSAIGGTLTSASVCFGENGLLTLSGNSNNPQYWESTTDITSGTWTQINNTTTTLNFTGTTVPTFYRAVVSDGCSNVTSSIGTVSIHNYWTGADIANPTDWNTAANWSDQLIPSVLCPDVYIPNTPDKPVLNTGATATIINLHIFANATLTVNGTGLLQIGGTISNNGILDVKNGSLELNGTGLSQNIKGSLFKDSTIKNLIISNDVKVDNTLNDTLKIKGTLSFGNSTGKLNTGNNITLLSTANATANVGIIMNSGNTITGNVTVERYINVGNGGSYHGKSWQFVATPAQGQTVWQTWMENGSKISTGYGTQISGAGGIAKGFDLYSAMPSLKYYNSTSNDYTGIENTGIAVYNQKGYMLFVRGDRSTNFPNVSNTTLRTMGTLFTPANPPPTTTVYAGKFESVGNPYASAIDLRDLKTTADSVYYVWDPLLGGAYGLGAYQTLYKTKVGGVNDNNFYPSPGGGSYGSVTTPNNFLQSGQAFFIASTTANGTVTFDESAKAGAGGNKLLLKTENVDGTGKIAQLRTNLYGVNADAGTFLADGNLIQFNEEYSNKTDGQDARKQVNSAENLGIKSGGKTLVVERRHGIVASDTIFYILTGTIVQNYQLELIASDLSAYGVQGYIEDTYLNTQTPLSMEGVTKINFAVTSAAGSKAANRFRIVFRQVTLLALPVTFISVKAYQKEAEVAVEWKVENEKDMQQYEVEKSTDGVRFSKSATVKAVNNGTQSYQWMDQHATPGTNYYRIRSVAPDGKVNYSTIVKVAIVFVKPSIGIYPNPITDGIIHLQLINQPEGMYGIRLLNSLGQVIVSKQAGHAGGNATENIKWDYKLAHGVYQLEIIKPGGEIVVIKVMY